MSESRRDYLPALRFRVLTPVFDAVVRGVVRESTFKPALIAQASLGAGQRVLDLGSGTGTLALMAKRDEPSCEVTGFDADPAILELARRKAASAGLDVSFDQGLAGELPYEAGAFDRVLSTLFFHHLTSEDKRDALGEVARVLRSGGELHLADWTAPADPLQALLSWQVRLLDGPERTRESFTGRLPEILTDVGFTDIREGQRLRTAFGTLGLLSARR